MAYPEDIANQHIRRDVRTTGKWSCLCDACRAQQAIDDATCLDVLLFGPFVPDGGA